MTNARDKANIPALNFSSTGIDDNASSTVITIESGGDVGIGTTNPAEKLQVMDTASNIPKIRIETSDGGNKRLDLSVESSVGTIASSQSAQQLAFKTAGGEAVRIDATGQVGIGTSSPDEKIHAESSVSTRIKSKTTTSTVSGGFEAWGNSSSYIKIYQLGSSFGGTTFGGVTGDNQALIEAQEVSSLAFTTQGGTPDIIFAPARTARMTIKNGGNVGIGTSSPAQKLHILSGGTTYLRTENTGISTVTDFGTDGTGSIVINRSAKPFRIFTNSTERVRIDNNSGDRVFIGTTSDVSHGLAENNRLIVSGYSGNGAGMIGFVDTGGNTDGTITVSDGSMIITADTQQTTASSTLQFRVDNSEKMRINGDGKALFNTTTSNNGMVISHGTDTSGNNACYGLERGSYKSTIGMTSVGGMTLKNFSGEINVIDSGGNSTTISPHNFSTIPNGASEELAWSYYSRRGDEENDFDNTKYISADITKVIRKVENLTGEKLIYSGTASTDDGSTVSQNIIQGLIDRIESLEAEVTALKNQP